jgi:hypothetical protein
MIDVVPRRDLDADEAGFWPRMPMAAGLFFGVAMGLFSLFMPVDPAKIERYGRRGVALIIVLVAGPAFGALYGVAFRRIVRQTMDKVYAGQPPFDAQPPNEVTLAYRLPASLRKSRFFAVGGVLYFGPNDVFFVPHSKRGATVRLGRPGTVNLAPLPAFRGGLWRAVTARSSTFAELGEPQVRRSFVVPAPSTTLPHLGALLDRLAERQQ